MLHSPLPPGRAGGVPSLFLFRRGLVLAALLLAALAGQGQTAAPRARPAPVAAPRASTPLRASAAIPRGRTTVNFAKGFTISYIKGGKVVTILSPVEQKTTATRYLLVPRGAARPAGYAGAIVLETPIRTLVGLSSMHVALVDFLGAADVLVGLGNLQYASAPRVRQRIAAGKIMEAGQGKELNNEQLIAQHPDLVMATGWPGEGLTRYQTLQAAGVPVMLNSEWVESTPLGRAEWVKVLAALLNKEDLVNQKFGQVAREYQRLAALGHRAAHKPTVVVGLPFKDVWYVPDADSYMAQFLRDAGATYQWNKTKSPQGSLALSFETVAPVALTADYWLHTGTATTKAEILAQDGRYAAFAPFKNGHLYNNNRRTNAQGSNDYWESGAVRPDLLLSDLIRILHPELVPTWQLYYYQPVK
ncbi:ABC transporter substrate-binding protein [Hymenobacter sp. H14-R3]|uniref:ABC transporter substrate-binding protein n=1 Tax=Hymenobacter sp. H14-R3 TaxID=3046308 RepID=UPI0024B9D972|nr:ABC transporter substrate-binding protein [Hymenobacter sp. H14-R3]MDJ0366468.1 ABC transporter substrate-binding protein [Hymenobacter sp. H14-R3]